MQTLTGDLECDLLVAIARTVLANCKCNGFGKFHTAWAPNGNAIYSNCTKCEPVRLVLERLTRSLP